jgi:hypothetical protein
MWLFLMQHYQLPTRLLDWTESPLIATYFASEDCPEKCNHAIPDCHDGMLFALSPYELNQHQINQFGTLMPDDKRARAVIEHAFNSEAPDVDYIAAILPAEIDIRMMVQLSVFTVHGLNRSLDNLPGNDRFLIGFRIPCQEKPKVKEELKHLGIRQSSLFPDLEHLAKEVSTLRFKEPPYPPPQFSGQDLIVDMPNRDPNPST